MSNEWRELPFTELLETLTKQPFSSGDGFMMACHAAEMGHAVTAHHATLIAENTSLRKERDAARTALEAQVAELTRQLAITVKQYEDAERAI